MNKPLDNPSKNFITVIKKNGLCSIQDLGRMASQHLGFSAGGVADEYAFLFANYLLTLNDQHSNLLSADPLSNTLNIAQLEITLGQISYKVAQKCTIAITGADCDATINDQPIKNWQVHQLNPNDMISFAQPKVGLHSYLAFAGGIQSKRWLNSQAQTSTEQSLAFSAPVIHEASIITLSDKCCVSDEDIKKTIKTLLPSAFYQKIPATLTLRFIPQALWLSLSTKQQQAFSNHQFSISANSNRMGYCLTPLPENTITSSKAPTLSKPVTFGTIQLPKNNQPIILMKERQTIGGYPVLGVVIQTDLFKLSQLRPGNNVQLIPTTLDFAQQQLKAFYQKFS